MTTTLDARRRLHLPKDLAAATGLETGLVVLGVGAEPGELIVSTPAAALARLRRAVSSALTLTGGPSTLSAALAARPGRTPAAPLAGGPATAALPADGPIMADTAVVTAVLDGAPGAEHLVALLPRLLLAEAVADDLLHTVLDAGLPLQADGPGCSFTSIMDTLTALGVAESGRDGAWASVRVIEYELTKAGVPTLAERTTLAVAAARGLPALLAGPIPLPDTIAVTAYDYRTLTGPDTTPGFAAAAPQGIDEPGAPGADA
ncbi:hypothetical protein [Actinoplanes cyaneus]|uniref:hypothetical protein n=1 Tax=Actinoplanes cyaneus TaxID=52696 RepID=UPI0019404A57|nr:hypothetical protein [Actinoplanes cyaneus]